MDAREGYMEIYHPPKYNEKEFVEGLRQLLESNLPQQLHVSSKVVEKVISDSVREAHELLFGFGRPQQVQDAIKIYYDEYNTTNNLFAINSLAQIYLEGEFVERDFKKSSQFYLMSAQKDDPEGWYRLGQMLEEGLATPDQLTFIKDVSRKSDPEEMALFCIDRAASFNHLDALTDLGYIYENGKKAKNGAVLVQPDIEKAVEHYSLAKKARFSRALNNLGNLYLNNKVRERVPGENVKKAIECLTMAKDQGNAKAIFNLGVCYERGNGVPVDLDRAKSYFKDSGSRGDLDGKLFYAFYVLQDAAFAQSEQQYLEAFKFLNEIVSKDPTKKEAYFYLGFLYENGSYFIFILGLGVPKEYKLALNYYDKAASLNHLQALVKVGDFYYVGAGELDQELNEAIKFYEMAARQGNVEAMLNLGFL